MYICYKCGDLREELSIIKEPIPYGDTVCYQEFADFQCDVCNGDYGKAKECRVCGDLKHEELVSDHESECMVKNLFTKENLENYIRQDDVKELFYIEWLYEISDFGNRDLLRVLEEEFLSRKSYKATDLIKEFVKEYADEFIDWCAKKERSD